MLGRTSGAKGTVLLSTREPRRGPECQIWALFRPLRTRSFTGGRHYCWIEEMWSRRADTGFLSKSEYSPISPAPHLGEPKKTSCSPEAPWSIDCVPPRLLGAGPHRGTLGPSPPLSGRGPIERTRANALRLRRRLRKAHAASPRGWPMAAGPASRLGPQSPGIKQGCGSNHT